MLQAVVNTFGAYPNVEIIKGAVPDTLGLVDAERVAFLSLDIKTRDPEYAAAEHFWDRMTSGAAIVLDSYRVAKAPRTKAGVRRTRRGVETYRCWRCRPLRASSSSRSYERPEPPR